MTTFILSADLFWGFNCILNLHDFNSNDEIIEYMKKELKSFLYTKNLLNLVEKVDSMNLHMHDSFENLKTSDIWYICDHPH